MYSEVLPRLEISLSPSHHTVVVVVVVVVVVEVIVVVVVVFSLTPLPPPFKSAALLNEHDVNWNVQSKLHPGVSERADQAATRGHHSVCFTYLSTTLPAADPAMFGKTLVQYPPDTSTKEWAITLSHER
ncbi:hypothetical protein ElyMa_006531200 [Elysia marginata]|uniref:Uncharacterized protein n=1 Tax=Elysia marginata TaxID=1093978 RepID=A0AAV4I9X1_9GAST|nr:hypothetical protein ElyMa_006531200 [Elysia marginata]